VTGESPASNFELPSPNALEAASAAGSVWQITPRTMGLRDVVVDVWRHRKLLVFVGTRALQKIYRRTVLGWLWLFINPLFPLALRALIFGGLIGVTSEGIPYFLFLVAGSIAWDSFASSLTWGTRGLEMNRFLVDQIYVPRALLPFGNAAPAFLDVVIKMAVFAAAVGYYVLADDRVYMRGGLPLLWAAGALVVVFVFSSGLSFFTSIWGEETRDMRFTLGQLLSVWYLLTPVLYPLSAVPEPYRGWMLANPLAVVVETFKWGLFGVGELRPVAFGVTAAAVLALWIAGLVYFARAEAQAIDER
jgi:lipopolysaccharide transport system permease protein